MVLIEEKPAADEVEDTSMLSDFVVAVHRDIRMLLLVPVGVLAAVHAAHQMQ